MTIREAYENLLIELNKVKSPHLHLEDFVYIINKAIQEVTNEKYNSFAVNQQLTDDLSALSSSVVVVISGGVAALRNPFTGALIENVPVVYNTRYGSTAVTFKLPDSYLHLLSNNCQITSQVPYKCYGSGYKHSHSARRLTSDVAAGTMNNAYLKPSLTRPYYQISDNVINGVSTPMISILYGNLNPAQFTLTQVDIDYLKKPTVVSLSVTEANAIIDNSTVLEFPEYMCNEIVKKATMLALENSSDPRLGSNPNVNKSILP